MEKTDFHVLDEVEKREIAKSLGYAIRQIREDVFNTEKHLVAQEFWHSLNGKRIVYNGDVENLINATLETVEG